MRIHILSWAQTVRMLRLFLSFVRSLSLILCFFFSFCHISISKPLYVYSFLRIHHQTIRAIFFLLQLFYGLLFPLSLTLAHSFSSSSLSIFIWNWFLSLSLLRLFSCGFGTFELKPIHSILLAFTLCQKVRIKNDKTILFGKSFLFHLRIQLY